MASVLGLMAFLGLFVGGQLLIDRLRGGSHCGACHHEGAQPAHEPGDCCGSRSEREAG